MKTLVFLQALVGGSLVVGGLGTYISALENERLRERREEFDDDLDEGVARVEAELENEVDSLAEERAALKKELAALEGKLPFLPRV